MDIIYFIAIVGLVFFLSLEHDEHPMLAKINAWAEDEDNDPIFFDDGIH